SGRREGGTQAGQGERARTGRAAARLARRKGLRRGGESGEESRASWLGEKASVSNQLGHFRFNCVGMGLDRRLGRGRLSLLAAVREGRADTASKSQPEDARHPACAR